MIHLRSLKAQRFKPWPDAFPYNVPVLATLDTLEFTTPVTFLVGENGSGKSTLLECIASAAGSITVGSEGVDRDRTLADIRQASKDLKLVWNKRTRRGFFMRSEDFFGYARRMEQTREELRRDMDAVDREYEGRSDLAKSLGKMSYAGELSAMQRSYGEGVDARSHGESYLRLFQARFTPGGLYLLDEPEAPLSPKRQLSFLVMLKEMIAQDAQFIIATHAPIILGFPGATILSCDSGRPTPMPFEELDHVTITRDFLIHRKMYLRELGIEDDT